jgi:hypothetical protein
VLIEFANYVKNCRPYFSNVKTNAFANLLNNYELRGTRLWSNYPHNPLKPWCQDKCIIRKSNIPRKRVIDDLWILLAIHIQNSFHVHYSHYPFAPL